MVVWLGTSYSGHKRAMKDMNNEHDLIYQVIGPGVFDQPHCQGLGDILPLGTRLCPLVLVSFSLLWIVKIWSYLVGGFSTMYSSGWWTLRWEVKLVVPPLYLTSGSELCQAQNHCIMFDLVQGILIIDQLKQTFCFRWIRSYLKFDYFELDYFDFIQFDQLIKLHFDKFNFENFDFDQKAMFWLETV